jgi:hypothetical protein
MADYLLRDFVLDLLRAGIKVARSQGLEYRAQDDMSDRELINAALWNEGNDIGNDRVMGADALDLEVFVDLEGSTDFNPRLGSLISQEDWDHRDDSWFVLYSKGADAVDGEVVITVAIEVDGDPRL